MKLITNIFLALVVSMATNTAHSTLITDSVVFKNSGSSFDIKDYHYGTNDAEGSSKVNTQALYLNGFDSSLGTLNSVYIRFGMYLSLNSEVEALDYYESRTGWDDVQGTALSGIKMDLDLTDPTGTLSYASYTRSVTQEASCSGNSQTIDDCDAKETDRGSFQTTFNFSSEHLDIFLDGPIRLNVTDSRYVSGSSSDSDTQLWANNNDSYWSGAAYLGYNYTEKSVTPVAAVPEPSTSAIMALGLLGFGLARRKIKK